MNKEMLKRMQFGDGFIAALDQSGGSTPKALHLYGIEPTAWKNEEEMFDLVHQMRTRIITNPSFNSHSILGAILFEMTMERKVEGLFTADYLWEKKGVVPFLKVDKGLDVEQDGVRLMKPIPGLDALLDKAVSHHIFGTKMRSVILSANPVGIQKVVKQQFEIAKMIIAKGLVPIIEPEVDINIPDKSSAEAILKEKITQEANKLGKDEKIMLKLSIPTLPNLYDSLSNLPCVVRVVALSGGYSQNEANRLLKKNDKMIASFSRALAQGLQASQSDEEFTAMLSKSIKAIYDASVNKDC